MNKTIAFSASVVGTLGAGAAYLFGKVDGGTFLAVTAAVNAGIWGLYQKYLKDEAVEAKLEAFLKLEDSEAKVKSLGEDKVILSKELNRVIAEVQAANVEVVEPVLEVEKPKRKRK